MVEELQPVLRTENEDGPAVRILECESGTDEARLIAEDISAQQSAGLGLDEIAVFYRVNALSRALEEAFRAAGIRYQIARGVEFYGRKEIKDVLGYLQVVNNPRDDVALMRIINTPARAIGKKTVERLRAHAIRYGLSMLNAARESGLIESLNKRAAVAVAKFVAI
ncbi:MAG: AAA family ATPase, partial [Planctomycetes bacterium]|nr:AAA family ATPase [Planctomycetota bacterium]